MEKPGLPSGTRDFGPAVMAKRQLILETIKTVFRKFGFQPLETPAMENLSTLTGKYGDEGDQLLFKVLNSGDFLSKVDETRWSEKNSKTITSQIAEKGLRYDLTVPFARYVVMNRHEVAFPFKRYQIQPVWRADKPQKGRYREFYQCDADVVGTTSLVCETEIILMINEVFSRLGITDYSIKVNHRGVLTGIAEAIGAKGNEVALFVAIDKLDKIGGEKVKAELLSKGFTEEAITKLFAILNLSGSTADKIQRLRSEFSSSESGRAGVNELDQVFSLVNAAGGNLDKVEFDISLARGLSYYTGCIFEVKIHNAGIGSVSGGGRYDNLTKAFGDKENVPGVGFSFGVDRIYDAMETLKLFPSETTASSKVLLCHFDEPGLTYGLQVLTQIRRAGIPSEIYPDLSKIKKQLDYANKKNIPFCVIIGSEEIQSGILTLKDMIKGEQHKLDITQLIDKVRG